MALAKGINSYVTEAEADAYFLNRLDVDAWTAADSTMKEQALISATLMLEDIAWVGMAISETQDLAFPRSGSYFDPRVGALVYLSGEVPARVIRATKELAYHLLNNEGLQDETGGALDIKVGSIELSKVSTPSKLSSVVRDIIKPLRVNGGSNAWFRAN
jgi:hypothetical protein